VDAAVTRGAGIRDALARSGQRRLGAVSRSVRSEDAVVAETSKFRNMIFPMSKNGETF
jgi:hypothetical protein